MHRKKAIEREGTPEEFHEYVFCWNVLGCEPALLIVEFPKCNKTAALARISTNRALRRPNPGYVQYTIVNKLEEAVLCVRSRAQELIEAVADEKTKNIESRTATQNKADIPMR